MENENEQIVKEWMEMAGQVIRQVYGEEPESIASPRSAIAWIGQVASNLMLVKYLKTGVITTTPLEI